MYINKEWTQLYLDALWHNVVSVKPDIKDSTYTLTVIEELTPPKISRLFTVETIYTVCGGALTVRGSITAEKQGLPYLPRFGYRVELPESFSSVRYYGKGPLENYPDFQEYALMGRFASPVQALCSDYVYPQEGGTRCGVRCYELFTSDESAGLRIESIDDPLCVTAFAHSIEEFKYATHRGDIIKNGTTEVLIDGFMSGVGTQSCGHPPTPQYRFCLNKDETKTFTFRITPLVK